MTRIVVAVLIIATVLALGGDAGAAPIAQITTSDIHDRAAALGRGVNLGNTLEAPNEGDWGFVIEEWMLAEIAAGGFDSVRVPIKWSAHAETNAPYDVDSAFFERIDWVVETALAHGLAVVIDLHHYDEIIVDPAGHEDRFLAIWSQIAARYAAMPETVFFEPLNEPHNALDADTWNDLLVQVLAVIRATNPTRGVIIGPHFWNAAWEIETLQLPAGDRNLIATFHYYAPFEFTHQGAEWVDGADAWLGTTWTGADEQLAQMRQHFDGVAAWAADGDRPVLLGEFGAYERADAASRSTWTAAVRAEAESRGFAWTYWEFGAGFGAYDRDAGVWNPDIYPALMPGGAPGGEPFSDVADDHPFAAEISWLAGAGITAGCDSSGTLFCPGDAVTRDQMASFLMRALGLVVPVGSDRFLDDDGSTHEGAIEALAAAGVTLGCDSSGTLFCPGDAVTREQMASFLMRALGLAVPVDSDRFLDDDGSTHEGAIEALAAAGVTLGCDSSGTRYCPQDVVTRGQMAAFLYRAFNGS